MERDGGRERVDASAGLRDEQFGCLAAGHVAIVGLAELSAVALVGGRLVLNVFHCRSCGHTREGLLPDVVALRFGFGGDDVGSRGHAAHGAALCGNGLHGGGLADGDGRGVALAGGRGRGAVGGVVDGGTLSGADNLHLLRLGIGAAGGGEVRRAHGHGFFARVHRVVERLRLFLAPDVVLQSGIVDERVAVVLQGIDSLVARQLDIVDGVLLRPAHEHFQEPRGQAGIGLAVEAVGAVGTAPGGDFALVAGHHVEIGARHVALDFVVGLEALACVAVHRAAAHQAVVVLGVIRHRAHLAEGQVAAAVVDVAVGGHYVEGIVAHGRRLVEPALRHEVLAVVGVALLAVVGTLLGAADDVAGGVRIPVAQVAVGTPVGGLISLPKRGVANVLMFVDDGGKRSLQGLALLAVGVLVVGAAVVGTLSQHGGRQRQQQ